MKLWMKTIRSDIGSALTTCQQTKPTGSFRCPFQARNWYHFLPARQWGSRDWRSIPGESDSSTHERTWVLLTSKVVQWPVLFSLSSWILGYPSRVNTCSSLANSSPREGIFGAQALKVEYLGLRLWKAMNYLFFWWSLHSLWFLVKIRMARDGYRERIKNKGHTAISRGFTGTRVPVFSF